MLFSILYRFWLFEESMWNGKAFGNYNNPNDDDAGGGSGSGGSCYTSLWKNIALPRFEGYIWKLAGNNFELFYIISFLSRKLLYAYT